MQFLTSDEAVRVLKAARQHGVREHLMVLLTLQHMMRATEICDLRLADVDLKTESITVRRLKGSLTHVQSLYRHKGSPLQDEVSTLRAWLKQRPSGGSYLFPSQKGVKLDRRSFWRIFKAIAVSAGVDPRRATPRVLKHTGVSFLVQRHVDLASVRQAAGHKSLSSTLRYTHATDAQACKAAQAAFLEM